MMMMHNGLNLFHELFCDMPPMMMMMIIMVMMIVKMMMMLNLIHELFCDMAAAKAKHQGRLLHRVALVAGHNVSCVMAAIDSNASHLAAPVQRHHGLVGDEERRHPKLLHQDLRHRVLLLLGGQGRLGHDDRLGSTLRLQLRLQNVTPEHLQIVPVSGRRSPHKSLSTPRRTWRPCAGRDPRDMAS